MSNDNRDLRRLINREIGAVPKPMGSGYTVAMPDGEGGQRQVPVEIATVMMLDALVTSVKELVELVKGQETGEMGG